MLYLICVPRFFLCPNSPQDYVSELCCPENIPQCPHIFPQYVHLIFVLLRIHLRMFGQNLPQDAWLFELCVLSNFVHCLFEFYTLSSNSRSYTSKSLCYKRHVYHKACMPHFKGYGFKPFLTTPLSWKFPLLKDIWMIRDSCKYLWYTIWLMLLDFCENTSVMLPLIRNHSLPFMRNHPS